MKNIAVSFIALVIGILAADIKPLVEFLNSQSAELLVNKIIVIPCLIATILLVIKHNHFIATYTDEYIPFQLSVVALVLTIIGLYLFTRIMFLGLIALIASSYWSRGTIKQYFPRKRRTS